MSGVRLLPSASRPAQAWKNGGGVTREVARQDNGAGDILWRVSIAEVREAGPFSHFPGIDRVLAVLDGRLLLDFDGGAASVLVTPDTAPHAFPGDVPVSGTPDGGPVTDLNLMVRRGAVRGALHRLPPGSSSPSPNPTATRMLVAAGEAQVTCGDETYTLGRLDALSFAPGATAPVLVHAAAACWLVDIVPLAGADQP
ncbi:HutD family protein [Nitrospirillum sp. BR 11164]|uniref:HutD/Ves family protein n=1 Tax=Nitrospirillum sp. BR 11164 TaxID=3104324 RepID=UPI002AFFE1EB|nr:HutD family protein [Nitrospirillum sp. BR 11164]MEA1648511.1 HutD family protein [Nitrospirillum sp. BR 11164]